MKINKLSSKLIKPQTPTPQNLKKYEISVIDQLVGPICLCVILFYKSKQETEAISQLQESLARILVEFYPLAGRYIENDHTVDCNDEGAEFIEAEALDVELIDLVQVNEIDQLNALLPERHFRSDEASQDTLMSIQATHFPSGGLAIAVSVTHRVFDASSLGTFLTAWSNAANPDKTVEYYNPSFNVIPSLLPYKDLSRGPGFDKVVVSIDGDDGIGKRFRFFINKRFRFNKEVLTSLRSRIGSSIGKPVSGVRVVCAVIAKAMIEVDRTKHGLYRDFMLSQAINLRDRTIPPMPKHLCGNFAIPSVMPRVQGKDMDIEELVRLLGDSARKNISGHAQILSPDHGDGRDVVINTYATCMRGFMDPEVNVIIFSDWSRFGFYEADFGWGKPVWTSIGKICLPMTVLMSNKEGDGIEAWVHLSPNDMRCFEQNQEIKLFTT